VLFLVLMHRWKARTRPAKSRHFSMSVCTQWTSWFKNFKSDIALLSNNINRLLHLRQRNGSEAGSNWNWRSAKSSVTAL